MSIQLTCSQHVDLFRRCAVDNGTINKCARLIQLLPWTKSVGWRRCRSNEIHARDVIQVIVGVAGIQFHRIAFGMLFTRFNATIDRFAVLTLRQRSRCNIMIEELSENGQHNCEFRVDWVGRPMHPQRNLSGRWQWCRWMARSRRWYSILVVGIQCSGINCKIIEHGYA